MTEPQSTLRTLVDLTAPLAEDIRLEEALQRAADAALWLAPADNSRVRILDTTGTKVLIGARGGEDAGKEPMPLEVSDGLLFWVVEHCSPALVGDASTDTQFGTAGDGDDAVKSVLEIPLVTGGKAFGSISVTANDANAFEELHQLVLTVLAGCTAPVIARARLERLSFTDHETLAYNDRYLEPRLKEEISRSMRQGYPLSVLVVDVDGFKRINTLHGRKAGDVVLQRLADRTRALARLSDVLVRKGGDEFVLIATDTPEASAVTFAERLRSMLAKPPILQDAHGTSIDVTVSIGVAAWNGQEAARTLVDRAYEAMHKAGKQGGDVVVAAGSGAESEE